MRLVVCIFVSSPVTRLESSPTGDNKNWKCQVESKDHLIRWVFVTPQLGKKLQATHTTRHVCNTQWKVSNNKWIAPFINLMWLIQGNREDKAHPTRLELWGMENFKVKNKTFKRSRLAWFLQSLHWCSLIKFVCRQWKSEPGNWEPVRCEP